jgi:DNA-directed RNA polymerase subunit RPC12/RpoP
MGEPTVEVLCQHCGQTFTAFLKDMADKNAGVVCPHCANQAAPNIAMPKN